MATATHSETSLTPWLNCPTLREALDTMGGDLPEKIPALVRLLENPASPVALPGNIDLYGHDCSHVLLGRAFSAEDEAFVIGFSMGTATDCGAWHVLLFKIAALWLYPSVYRLTRQQLHIFDRGFAYARTLDRRNLHRFDFRAVETEAVAELRGKLGIDMAQCSALNDGEIRQENSD